MITEGVAGVKIDRLATALGVTRGGFYHHFDNHSALLKELINHWAQFNDMLPPGDEPRTPQEALQALERLSERLLMETDFSPAFDMAVREWARVDKSVKRFVDRVDAKRLARLAALLTALGYEPEEAHVRARVVYYHQMGFYNLGHHLRQTKKERRKYAPVYLRILCGERYTAAKEETSGN